MLNLKTASSLPATGIAHWAWTRVRVLFLLTVLPTVAPPLVYAEAQCADSCQQALVEAYFDRLSAVYRKGSTTDDIDHLFTLFHPDVQYRHLDYGANFNYREWKEAFQGNLQRGAYAEAQEVVTKPMRFIFGKKHVAVEYQRGISEGEEWTPDDRRGLLALFEFHDGKIITIEEYW